jgi:hypothetical protein
MKVMAHSTGVNLHLFSAERHLLFAPEKGITASQGG